MPHGSGSYTSETLIYCRRDPHDSPVRIEPLELSQLVHVVPLELSCTCLFNF